MSNRSSKLKPRYFFFSLLVAFILIITACAPQPETPPAEPPQEPTMEEPAADDPSEETEEAEEVEPEPQFGTATTTTRHTL